MIALNTTTPRKIEIWIKDTERKIEALTGKSDWITGSIQEIVDRSTIKNFEAKGRPTWPPRKHYYGWPILRKTQTMMRKTLSYIRYNKRWQRVGNVLVLNIKSTYYGLYHQYGTRKTDKHPGLPHRPFVRLQTPERDEIVSLVRRIITRNE
jgi:phage gpG-like protein